LPVPDGTEQGSLSRCSAAGFRLPKTKSVPGEDGYICHMEVNDQLVDKLAKLARLRFSPEEKESIRQDLQQMIGFVDKLNELNTSGIEPVLHMSDTVNVLRKDEVKGSVSREEALQNAADHDAQFFKVPKVIQQPSTDNSK